MDIGDWVAAYLESSAVVNIGNVCGKSGVDFTGSVFSVDGAFTIDDRLSLRDAVDALINGIVRISPAFRAYNLAFNYGQDMDLETELRISRNARLLKRRLDIRGFAVQRLREAKSGAYFLDRISTLDWPPCEEMCLYDDAAAASPLPVDTEGSSTLFDDWLALAPREVYASRLFGGQLPFDRVQ